MSTETINVARIMVQKLESGMIIINIGTVESIDIYANTVIVFLKDKISYFGDQTNKTSFSPYLSVLILK